MTDNNWTKPVEVHLDHSGKSAVAGPFDALVLLTDSWPTMRGLNFVRARKFFEEAVAEAKLHAH